MIQKMIPDEIKGFAVTLKQALSAEADDPVPG